MPHALLKWNGRVNSSSRHCIINGATGTGKTFLAHDILVDYSRTFSGTLRHVHLSYKEPQAIYGQLKSRLIQSGVTWSSSHTLVTPVVPPNQLGWTVWMIDDFAAELLDDKTFAKNLNTLRHSKIQCIILLHRIFSNSAPSRAITVNVSLYYFTAARRQLPEVRTIATKLGMGPLSVAAFLSVCKDRERLRFLLIDASPDCPDDLRLRSVHISPTSTVVFTPLMDFENDVI